MVTVHYLMISSHLNSWQSWFDYSTRFLLQTNEWNSWLGVLTADGFCYQPWAMKVNELNPIESVRSTGIELSELADHRVLSPDALNTGSQLFFAVSIDCRWDSDKVNLENSYWGMIESHRRDLLHIARPNFTIPDSRTINNKTIKRWSWMDGMEQGALLTREVIVKLCIYLIVND